MVVILNKKLPTGGSPFQSKDKSNTNSQTKYFTLTMETQQLNKDLLQESVLSVLFDKKAAKDVYLIDSEKCLEATHSAFFRKEEKRVTVNEINDCPICFEKLNSTLNVLQCGHVFHSNCEETWRKNSWTCAVCREAVTFFAVVEECWADYYRGLSIGSWKAIMTKLQTLMKQCQICKEKTNSPDGLVCCDHIVLAL